MTVSEIRKDLISRTAIEPLRHEPGRYVLTGAVEVDVSRLRDTRAALDEAVTAGERRRPRPHTSPEWDQGRTNLLGWQPNWKS